MTTVTIPVDEELVARAEAAANLRGTTLAQAGREWLLGFVLEDASEEAAGLTPAGGMTANERLARYDDAMARLSRYASTGPYTRDEMNGR